MPVTRLSLSNFRSYADALVAPGPGLVILTGENGAGKTNVLEAGSLLSPGRGLRGASLAEMARRGGPGGFAVAARRRQGRGRAPGVSAYGRRPGAADLDPGPRQGEPQRRQVRINGAPASATSLGEW